MPERTRTDPSPGRAPGPDAWRPCALFVSYSHRNEAVKDRLLTHLAPLKRNGLVRTGSDRQIEIGDPWRDEIDGALARADGAILPSDSPTARP